MSHFKKHITLIKLNKLKILIGSLCIGLIVTWSIPCMALSHSQLHFINLMKTAVSHANYEIREERHEVLELQQSYQHNHRLSSTQLDHLNRITSHYDLSSFKISLASDWKKLLLRVDIVPSSLALAQAINESAWGQSRFAHEGKNYFGQRCLQLNCGIIPTQRTKGQNYEVRTFSSMEASVASYMLNLNTHPAYQKFRLLRANQRTHINKLNSIQLASSLHGYSQKRQEYSRLIAHLIRKYSL